MISDSDVGCDTGRTRRNGRNTHSDLIGRLSRVEVDVLTVGVDGFAGVNLKPFAAAVEVGLESQSEVGTAGYDSCEAVFTAVRMNFEGVINAAESSRFVVFNEVCTSNNG